MQKRKNNKAQPKFTGSYKKKAACRRNITKISVKQCVTHCRSLDSSYPALHTSDPVLHVVKRQFIPCVTHIYLPVQTRRYTKPPASSVQALHIVTGPFDQTKRYKK